MFLGNCNSKSSRGEACNEGRDEKGCLLLTEKNAAVDVDVDYCLFLLVDVDHPALFYWSTSTILHFSTVDVDKTKKLYF